jgi:hypothetical protein
MGLHIHNKEVRDGQIFVTISKVSPNIYEKSRQIFVTIIVILRSTLLSFCQIFVKITSSAQAEGMHHESD